jgi:hypothetical protein
VRRDEIDRGRKLRMINPGVPDFAGRNWNRSLALDALDHLDQVVDFLLAAENRFIADHDAVDVSPAAGEIDYRAELALVAARVLVDPGADRCP